MPDKEKDSSSNIQKLIKNMNIEKISEVTKNPEYKKIIEENRDTQLADIPEIKEEKRNLTKHMCPCRAKARHATYTRPSDCEKTSP